MEKALCSWVLWHVSFMLYCESYEVRSTRVRAVETFIDATDKSSGGFDRWTFGYSGITTIVAVVSYTF